MSTDRIFHDGITGFRVYIDRNDKVTLIAKHTPVQAPTAAGGVTNATIGLVIDGTTYALNADTSALPGGMNPGS